MARVQSLFFVVLVLFSLPMFSCAHPLEACEFDKIYQLGDSISDTGNLIRESPIGAASAFARLPYGETYFDKPTGRCSNGLLMIDFIARAAGLPLLDAYKNRNGNFSHGANFAVAGSTALPSEVLASKHILNPVTNSSLNVQLGWMSEHFNSICHGKTDCAETFENTLFMVGEIGGNDYNYALFQGKTIEELRDMVPEVVASIMNAVETVIGFGASRVIVPGNFPIGCLPIYLTAFQANTSAAYDEQNCLKGLNNFAIYHNEQLQDAIQGLRLENPDVTILYGDYYNAYQYLLRAAPLVGFDVDSIQKACCGIGEGRYNFNLTRMCGAPEATVCPEPYTSVSWDGVHLTQRAYKIMASWLMQDFLPRLQCI